MTHYWLIMVTFSLCFIRCTLISAYIHIIGTISCLNEIIVEILVKHRLEDATMFEVALNKR